MFKNLNYVFFFGLMLTTIITFSARSWFVIWMGLEMNLLMFLAILYVPSSVRSINSMIKYFLIQTTASSIFLFAILNHTFINNLDISLYVLVMMYAALVKLGFPPFHFWLMNMIEDLSWMNFFILHTWQKINPLVLISYLYSSVNNFDMMILILSAMLISSLSVFNVTSMRKFLMFSSINHLSWILVSLQMSNNLWIMYFFLYMIILAPMIFTVYIYKMNYLSQLTFMNLSSKLLFMMNLFSMGGLPPLLGFYPKWMVISLLVMEQKFFLAFMMVIFTLLMVYIYMRISFSNLLIYQKTNKAFNFKLKNSFLLFYFMLNLFAVFLIHWMI